MSEACAACSYRIENDIAGTGEDGGDGTDTGNKIGHFNRRRSSLLASAGAAEEGEEVDPSEAFAASIAQQEEGESKRDVTSDEHGEVELGEHEQLASDGRSVIAPHRGRMAGLLAIERGSNKSAGERFKKVVKTASFKGAARASMSIAKAAKKGIMGTSANKDLDRPSEASGRPTSLRPSIAAWANTQNNAF